MNTQTAIAPNLIYLDKNGTFATPKRRHGGYRPGAGRPKGSKNKKTIELEQRKAVVQDHVLEHILHKERVTYFDKNGNLKTRVRSRLELLLDMLFHTAMHAQKPRDQIRACCVYLDRTIGKPGYIPGHYATEREAARHVVYERPVRPPTKAEEAGINAYNEALESEARGEPVFEQAPLGHGDPNEPAFEA